MQSKHLAVIIIAFLIILIAAYFGASIHNSKTNHLIDYLNEMDNIQHYNVELIPSLNFRGAVITLPLILIVLVIEVLIVIQSNNRVVKNIAIGSIFASLIVILIAILTLSYPNEFDMSRWGYIWITMAVVLFAGNVLSIFIKPTIKKV